MKKATFITIIVLSIFTISLLTTTRLIVNKTKVQTWQKTFGGKNDDEANSIQQTTDGGYIVAGSTESLGTGGKDVYILKLNSKGEIEWQRIFDGGSNDQATSIQQTTDGGYIVAGWTESFSSGGTDGYILKLNSNGGVEWQKTFGGKYNDEAYSIQQTTDGGYIVAGETYSFETGGYYDVYILKLNSKGEIEWQKTFGGDGFDIAMSIQQTADGGYIIAGWTYSFDSDSQDVYILKLNAKGEIEWQKTFGGKYIDEAYSIQQTADGGYIVAGCTESFGFGLYVRHVYILKLNPKGEVEWEKTFGEDTLDIAMSVQQTTDGGYIIAGWTYSFDSDSQDVYILKLNSKGDLEWQKTFGGKDDDVANSVQQTIDGGYIVAGWTSSPDFGGDDVYILKLDSKGDLEWQKTFGGEGIAGADSIQQTKDGGYIVAGDKGGDVYILKLNSKGEIQWQKTFGGEHNDAANSIQQTTDGGYIVAGLTYSFGSGYYNDAYILKLNSKGQLEWQKTFGGEDYDGANSIQQTKDGGYIAAGWTESFGSGEYDAYVLKLNSKGEVEWQKTFGGKDYDEANSIQQTTDGGYIVAGWTKSFGSGGADVYILKLNSKGEVEWQKTFGGGDSDGAFSNLQTTDGGYIVAGWTWSFGSGGADVYILKLDSKGEVEE